MRDIQRGEIVPQHRHHHRDSLLPRGRQPIFLRLFAQRIAVLGGERRADGFQILTGIKPVGDGAGVLAERFAVSQIGGAREHIDLRARVIDVIFARDLEAGKLQQVGERVAEHGAAAMADMHRSGRICRHVFDVNRRAVPDVALAVVRSESHRFAQDVESTLQASASD